MHLKFSIMVKDELAYYAMKSDGSCAAKEYAVGEIGLYLVGAIIKLVNVIIPENQKRMVCLYLHNHGYAVRDIVQLVTKNNIKEITIKPINQFKFSNNLIKL